ncbi:arylesterase [Oceanospirillum beijerinckii]|uniref:arylesterase n=1 Tax=Oceanospirillum beijerinckii TaxID=64976 RepID=UPI0003FD1DDA|nr:arylesterase [Oceanospirillum beijerinckii]
MVNQRPFISVQWLVLALLITLYALSAQSVQAAQTARLLVLGDSISAGYGMKPEQGWVTLLQDKLRQEGYDYQVINASISGETSQGGLTRLPALLNQHQPELVLIELGGNDGLRGLPLKLLQHNLSKLVQLTQQQQAQPVLLGIQLPPNYGRRYTQAFANIYPALAEQYQIPVMPFILEGISTDPDKMQSDGIHPTAKAQQQLLNNIWPVLQPLLAKS